MEIPFRQSPNYTAGGTTRTLFVWHGTLGGFKGSIETLCASVRKDAKGNNLGRASAHYVIGRKEGEVIQLVKLEDTAWHAGIIDKPKKRFLDIAKKSASGKLTNPNQYSIGIEFCWGYDTDGDKVVEPFEKRITDWQFKCVHDIMKQSGIKLDGKNIVTHSDITSYKSDDLSLDIEEYYKRNPIK